MVDETVITMSQTITRLTSELQQVVQDREQAKHDLEHVREQRDTALDMLEDMRAKAEADALTPKCPKTGDECPTPDACKDGCQNPDLQPVPVPE